MSQSRQHSAEPAEAHVVISPKVVHDTIDGEVIMLDLGLGLYHTLNDRAGRIWQHVIAYGSPDSIARSLAAEDGLTAGEARSMVAHFLKALEKEALVEIRGDRPGWVIDGVGFDGTAPNGSTSDNWPAIETYRDMRAALVLDPIHEVDESGWPTPRQPVDETDGQSGDS